MVKQTQTIRRQQRTNYLSESHHFVGLALKRLTQNVSESHLLIMYAKLFKIYPLPSPLVREYKRLRNPLPLFVHTNRRHTPNLSFG